MKRPVLIGVGAIVVYVLAYAYLLLPLDLGLGLVGGYHQLGSLGFGLTTTVLWLGLTALACWGFGRLLGDQPSLARRLWVTVLGISVTLLASYPLVVLYMYTALDAVMPAGQIGFSALAGRAYWLLLAASAVVVIIAPIALVWVSRRPKP